MEEANKLVEKIAKFNNVDIEEVLPLLIQENGIDSSINIADNKVVPRCVWHFKTHSKILKYAKTL
jgi:hypothetical protein